jgi:hypothetical protein
MNELSHDSFSRASYEGKGGTTRRKDSGLSSTSESGQVPPIRVPESILATFGYTAQKI